MEVEAKLHAKAPAAHAGPMPWVQLKAVPAGPLAFKRMLGGVDPRAKPGDMVSVYDKAGAPYGVGFYNPRSRISLRLLTRETAGFEAEAFMGRRIDEAIALRRSLGVEAVSDAYRLVYDYGDGLPGVVVDRYADVLALEFYSLGMFRQAARLERLLAARFPGAKFVRRASEYSAGMEGFDEPKSQEIATRVKENGISFEVRPSGGRKTGFFCDQRDNRRDVAALARDKTVLDVCSYTGGFGIYAKKLGEAAEVTCVELDPEASEAARKNANINQARVRTVCADAFPFLRQMALNEERFGLVVLDPYKLIASKEGFTAGRQKYIDFNRLALSVVEPGGLLVTCSCSGMLSWEEFQQFVRTAAGSAGRRVQIFRRSGAGADHPVAADYPEGEYLKVLWCRVL